MSTNNTEKNLQSPPSTPRKNKRKFTLDKKQGAFLLFVLLVCSLPTYFISVQHVQAHEKKILGYSQNSFFVWSENSATKIDPLYKPHADAAMVNNTLWLKGAKGEFESTQLVVRKLNGASLDNLTVSLTPFVDQNGNDAIGVENQSIGEEEIIRGEFFDRIKPLSYQNGQITVEDDRNYPLWYTVYIPRDANYGTYHANVSIQRGQEDPVVIDVSLRVYKFSMPQTHTYQTMVNPPTSNKNLMDNFLNHKIDFGGVPFNMSFDSETLEWDINWEQWEDLMLYAVDNGLNQFKIPSPKGYVSEFEQYGMKYNESLVNYYSEVASQLRLRGWIDRGYIYYIDEPSVEECRNFEPFCELVHSIDSELRILLTTAPRSEISFLFNDIDIWAPIEHDLDRYYDTLMQLRALGKEVVYYPCLFPKTPYANIQAYNELIDSKVLGWQVFYYDIDGFLYWHTSAYYYNMHGYGYNSWLDGWLIYPRDPENGIYDSSIRWEALRDGFEDIEYFYKLKQLNESRELFQDEITDLLGDMENIMRDFRTFSQDPSQYLEYRERAAALIEQILSI